ncbi:MAG: hypothetical protein CMI54_02550 [Parcubacteria group bacterium]|jgi:hypothetical protein|nr:hypothetical protein [Parcubacteria group bacterium]|tara:strand:+ start:3407 stop:3613 length:207 start_codon:yes stop_codon:yes gene_type:complete
MEYKKVIVFYEQLKKNSHYTDKKIRRKWPAIYESYQAALIEKHTEDFRTKIAKQTKTSRGNHEERNQF